MQTNWGHGKHPLSYETNYDKSHPIKGKPPK